MAKKNRPGRSERPREAKTEEAEEAPAPPSASAAGASRGRSRTPRRAPAAGEGGKLSASAAAVRNARDIETYGELAAEAAAAGPADGCGGQAALPAGAAEEVARAVNAWWYAKDAALRDDDLARGCPAKSRLTASRSARQLGRDDDLAEEVARLANASRSQVASVIEAAASACGHLLRKTEYGRRRGDGAPQESFRQPGHHVLRFESALRACLSSEEVCRAAGFAADDTLLAALARPAAEASGLYGFYAEFLGEPTEWGRADAWWESAPGKAQSDADAASELALRRACEERSQEARAGRSPATRAGQELAPASARVTTSETFLLRPLRLFAKGGAAAMGLGEAAENVELFLRGAEEVADQAAAALDGCGGREDLVRLPAVAYQKPTYWSGGDALPYGRREPCCEGPSRQLLPEHLRWDSYAPGCVELQLFNSAAQALYLAASGGGVPTPMLKLYAEHPAVWHRVVAEYYQVRVSVGERVLARALLGGGQRGAFCDARGPESSELYFVRCGAPPFLAELAAELAAAWKAPALAVPRAAAPTISELGAHHLAAAPPGDREPAAALAARRIAEEEDRLMTDIAGGAARFNLALETPLPGGAAFRAVGGGGGAPGDGRSIEGAAQLLVADARRRLGARLVIACCRERAQGSEAPAAPPGVAAGQRSAPTLARNKCARPPATPLLGNATDQLSQIKEELTPS